MKHQREETPQMKYIAMDAHSRRSVFTVRNQRGQVEKRGTVETNEREILGFVESVKGPKQLVFEECSLAQWLYLLLKDEVEEVFVCDPKDSSRFKGAKTDKIDADELSDLLRVGKLKTVYHSDEKFMDLRAVISGYQDLNQEIVRTKNRYNALFRRVAITNDEGGKFYRDRELISTLPTKAMQFVAEPLFDQIEQLEEHKKRYEQEFEKNARRHKEIKLLMTIPGIGVKHANRLVGVLVTPNRFSSKYKLYAYARLVKHSRTSDGKPCGKRTSQGQSVLKDVFKNAALAAIRSDCAFRRKYESMLAAGKNERDARNDVARRIAATVLGVWKAGKKYDDKLQEVTREREPRHRQ